MKSVDAESSAGETVRPSGGAVGAAGSDSEEGYNCGLYIYRAAFLHQEQGEKRDPEAHSAKKGNTWHFGYKSHIGVDSENCLVHTGEVTAANIQDVTVTSDLLSGEEEAVCGDSGYLSADNRPKVPKKNKASNRIRFKLNCRPGANKNRSIRSKVQIKRREHEKSFVRAKVEHVFAVVKLQLRLCKTRYQGYENRLQNRI